MIHWDDIDPILHGGRPEEHLVWVERTVRMLIPNEALTETFSDQVSLSLELNVQSASQLGRPFECERCGLVGINTVDYPWGAHKYMLGRYCPHCDGAEDVG